jgi:hypothetical protein
MRTIEEIKAEYIAELDKAAETGKETKARSLRAELVNALTKSIPTGRLESICNAERDGRVVVLPCKVGDTVYDRFCDAWTVREIDLYEDEKVLARCGHKGTDDYCALYSDEIFLTREEAEAALRKEQGDER